jgi:hypothetical protein
MTWRDLPEERRRAVWLRLLDDALEFAEFPVRVWEDVARHVSGSGEVLPCWIKQMEELGFSREQPVFLRGGR